MSHEAVQVEPRLEANGREIRALQHLWCEPEALKVSNTLIFNIVGDGLLGCFSAEVP